MKLKINLLVISDSINLLCGKFNSKIGQREKNEESYGALQLWN